MSVMFKRQDVSDDDDDDDRSMSIIMPYLGQYTIYVWSGTGKMKSILLEKPSAPFLAVFKLFIILNYPLQIVALTKKDS